MHPEEVVHERVKALVKTAHAGVGVDVPVVQLEVTGQSDLPS